MARMNEDCGAWVADLLEIGPRDRVLEIGFGPGAVVQRVAKLAPAGNVAGIDPSREMVEQARARNAIAIQGGRVDLRCGSVESLPFADNTFDKALAINSMQVWPNALAGLREIRRVMRSGGTVALGVYAVFGAAEQKLDGNRHRRRLRAGAPRGGGSGLLYAGGKAVMAPADPCLQFDLVCSS